jgi:hypothetical protein
MTTGAIVGAVAVCFAVGTHPNVSESASMNIPQRNCFNK